MVYLEQELSLKNARHNYIIQFSFVQVNHRLTKFHCFFILLIILIIFFFRSTHNLKISAILLSFIELKLVIEWVIILLNFIVAVK